MHFGVVFGILIVFVLVLAFFLVVAEAAVTPCDSDVKVETGKEFSFPLHAGVFVNKELYERLHQKWHDEIKNVEPIGAKEILFMREDGIDLTGGVKELKTSLTGNLNIWIDSMRELSTEVEVSDLEEMLPHSGSLFTSIVTTDHIGTILDVLKKAFSLKVKTEHGTNSEWDIFFLNRTYRQGETVWIIAFFRMKALRIDNIGFIRWGHDAINIDFIGAHIRPMAKRGEV